MQPVLTALAEHFEAIDLPLRSIENEWGPGQLECTFAPKDALTTADNLILFRSATRQITRRMGYLASFMARPAIPGFCASGWHLHQSLSDASGKKNLFMPSGTGDPLSPAGMHYLAGLLAHAQAATPFTTPTINGYRRYKPNSLAPDRATWAYDHRGVMARVLGAPHDPATRIENRIGEPSANPYLYIAAQIVSGLDGIAQKREPGPQELNPYNSDFPLLPKIAARCACGAGMLEPVPRAIRRDLHPLFPRVQTHRAWPVREVEERERRRLGSSAESRPNGSRMSISIISSVIARSASDEAIHLDSPRNGLLRFARNDALGDMRATVTQQRT